MNLSMRWLREFVPIDMPPRAYAEGMTMSGSKVEGWEQEGSEIERVAVGKILSVEKHPDADSLVICSVDAGQGAPVQIVTGATNVFAGAVVPVALDGAVLPGGKTIKTGKLRGVESCGMLCSLSELGLTAHDFPYAIEDGIFIIQEDCKIGQDIQSAIGLDDLKVEFEITSNRPDCLSMIGLARETAVTFGLPLKLHNPAPKGGVGNISEHLSVEVHNSELCPRYVARMVTDVKIEPSPRWMRERLRACGVRPINNIVDITNYVMLEYGQPMHAFDHRTVAGGKIVVRGAAPGETLTTLDGVVRTLLPEMLVIADQKAPSAVAGVMGGEFSGIADDTTTIVFESANFKGSSVRLTSKKLGLRTESSGRFEKGLDPQSCLPAIQRACELIELLGAGKVMDGVIDVDNSARTPLVIELDPVWVNGFLGIDISWQQMAEILVRLDFKVEGHRVTVPSYRADVEDKADLAEEIARIYGYDKIPSTTLSGLAQGSLTPRQKFDRRIHNTLLGLGLYEIITYSFISPRYYDKINLPADSDLRRSVVISNPLGEDTSIMRTTAIPSMLEVLARNYNNRNPAAALYEMAVEYHPREEGQLPEEAPQVMLGMYGGDADFFRLKGAVEVLLERLAVTGWEVESYSGDPAFHPGRCARLMLGGKVLGILGEVHPGVAENYGLGVKAYVAQLDTELLFAAATASVQYRPLPKYPATTRDLALICDDQLPVAGLERAIREAAGELLEKIELFDVYRGQQIAAGKKSVAYTLTLRAADRTLTDAEADAATDRILTALAALGATLRA